MKAKVIATGLNYTKNFD